MAHAPKMEVQVITGNFLKIAQVMSILAFGPALVFAGEEMFEGLKVTTDSSGIITSIAQSTPATYLNTEAEFAFVLSPAGIPASGTVTYKNNLQRSMKRDEVTLHFRQIGGPNAVWDYYAQHGKTVSYPPDNGKLPPEAYGKVSRIICVDGSQYIGKLSSWANKPEGFSLTIDGASGGPVVFFNGKVKEIQQIK
jgi:hypothetical protein